MLYLDNSKYEYVGVNDYGLYVFKRIGSNEFLMTEEAKLKHAHRVTTYASRILENHNDIEWNAVALRMASLLTNT